MGTPAIALPALRALAQTTQLVGVVCQPDRPRGRGMKLSPCPVKQLAIELSTEVHQPVAVRKGNLDQWLRERDVDLAVVLAYGRILPPSVLSAPRWGCVNLHASLLPAYRGAAPIQWALINGETRTGISLMQMEEGLDTGPVYCRRSIDITPSMDAGALTDALAELAAEVIREDLRQVVDGARPQPQDSELATYAPPIHAEHCGVDWTRDAASIVNQIRGLSPKPAAVTWLDGKRLRLLTASSAAGHYDATPGQIVRSDGNGIVVACGESGGVALERAQLEGKRALDARDLVNGRVLPLGALLTAR